MTKKYNWQTNDSEGRKLRRAIKRLSERLDTTGNTHDMVEISRALAYLAMAKSTLAKHDFDRDIEARIEELEQIAGIAKKGTIER